MNRRHDIDALRVIAFALLIVYHSAMVYVASWEFHIKSSYQMEWLQWPMLALNRWRMPLLFMLSGIAIGLAYDATGSRKLAVGRLRRVLPPLIFGILVVVAVQAYCEARVNGGIESGLGAFLLRYWQLRPWPGASFTGAEYGFTWNHLWYLAYLLPYTLLLAALLPILDRLRKSLTEKVRPVWLLMPLAWLIAVRLWVAPYFPETHAFIGDWAVHADSLPLFLLGFLLARAERFWSWVARARWPLLFLALLTLSLELSLRWLARNLSDTDVPVWLLQLPRWEMERVARASYTWSALLCIFGFGRAMLDRPSRWLGYCSQAIFPWYVLHQTLIVVLAYWLIPLRLGAGVEALLVFGGTVIGCVLLYEALIRRVSWLRPLFGLTHKTARLKPAHGAQSTAG